jgi:hypothetical protein
MPQNNIIYRHFLYFDELATYLSGSWKGMLKTYDTKNHSIIIIPYSLNIYQNKKDKEENLINIKAYLKKGLTLPSEIKLPSTCQLMQLQNEYNLKITLRDWHHLDKQKTFIIVSGNNNKKFSKSDTDDRAVNFSQPFTIDADHILSSNLQNLEFDLIALSSNEIHLSIFRFEKKLKKMLLMGKLKKKRQLINIFSIKKA